MSGLFVNKVIAAGLAAGLGLILINKFSGFLMQPDIPKPENFAYKLESSAQDTKKVTEPVPFPSPGWLAARNAEKGAKVFKKCKSCHTADNSLKDGTGPHLWGVVGRPKAAVEGFSYSDAMRNKSGVWGYEELDMFLAKPSKYIPKNKMAFNGIKKEADRAALIEFLRLAADTPIAPLSVEEQTEEAMPVADGNMEENTQNNEGGH